MSNEYKDWRNDNLVALNDKMWEAEFLPDGWVDTFIPDLKKELADTLGSYVDDFEVLQIKDKYAELRLYWRWKDRDYTDDEIKDRTTLTTEVEEIIHKYMKISTETCAFCGNEATHLTYSWVMPICEECEECYEMLH